jgi:hypothetical protein
MLHAAARFASSMGLLLEIVVHGVTDKWFSRAAPVGAVEPLENALFHRILSVPRCILCILCRFAAKSRV